MMEDTPGSQAPPELIDRQLVGPDGKSRVDMKAQEPKKPIKFKPVK